MKQLMKVTEVKYGEDECDVTLSTVSEEGKQTFKGYSVIRVGVPDMVNWQFGQVYEQSVDLAPEVPTVAEATAQTEAQ